MINEKIEVKIVDTNFVRIYMAGDMGIANQVCRAYTFQVGLCVTLTKTEYIYTGGAESGFIVELINYPRFPSNKDKLLEIAEGLAEDLMEANYQMSYTIMTPKKTFWYSRRDK